jgi:hypothetical protein
MEMDLMNFSSSTWNIPFRPTRDVLLTGLGVIFDPMPMSARPSLGFGLWQDEVVSNDDRLATLSSVLGEDFQDAGLNRYLFQLASNTGPNTPQSVSLEKGRTYILTAQVNFEGQWPEQFGETQQFPFATTSGSLVVLGGGRGLTPPPNREQPPLVVELDTQAALAPHWNFVSNGEWSAPGNWRGRLPNGIDDYAIFGAAITQARTVSVNESITVGRIDFNNANTYTISGTNLLTLSSVIGDAQINVQKGSHAIAAPLMLANDTAITVKPATSTLSIADLTASGVHLVKDGAGTLAVNNVRAAGMSVTWGKVVIMPNAGTSVVAELSITGDVSPSATVDLTNNAAVVDYSGTSPAPTIRQQLRSGRGGPGPGRGWNGMGITSSAAAAANAIEHESRSVGYAENAALPLGPYNSFRGQPVDDTSIVMAFTRTGDANLDGVVNDDDVTIVGATYAPGVPQPAWAMGDFDYNGFVDDDDVTLLGAFYDPSAAPLVSGGVVSGEQLAAVPEPPSIALLVIGLLGILLALVRRKLHSG